MNDNIKRFIIIFITYFEVLCYFVVSLLIYNNIKYQLFVDDFVSLKKYYFFLIIKEAFHLKSVVLFEMLNSFLSLVFVLNSYKKHKRDFLNQYFTFYLSIFALSSKSFCKVFLILYSSSLDHLGLLGLMNNLILFFYLLFYFFIFISTIYTTNLKKTFSLYEIVIIIFLILIILFFNILNSLDSNFFMYYNFLQDRFKIFIYSLIFIILLGNYIFSKKMFFILSIIFASAELEFYFFSDIYQIISNLLYSLSIFIYIKNVN